MILILITILTSYNTINMTVTLFLCLSVTFSGFHNRTALDESRHGDRSPEKGKRLLLSRKKCIVSAGLL